MRPIGPRVRSAAVIAALATVAALAPSAPSTAFAQPAAADASDPFAPIADDAMKKCRALMRNGQFDDALALLGAPIGFLTGAAGPNHPKLAEVYALEGEIYEEKREKQKALASYEKALRIAETAKGADSELAVRIGGKVGIARWNTGDIDNGEALVVRAAALYEKAGDETDDAARAFSFAALYHKLRHRTEEGRKAAQRAVSLREKLFGPDSPSLVHSLTVLAELSPKEEAQRLLERALPIAEKAGARAMIALVLSQLANLSEAYVDRFLQTSERLYGPDDPFMAATLVRAGARRRALGNLGGSRDLLDRGMRVAEAQLGARHVITQHAIRERALTAWAANEPDVAVRLLSREGDLREAQLAATTHQNWNDTETARLQMHFALSRAVHLHIGSAPGDPRAADMAMRAILRLRGRDLDITTDSTARLRKNLDPEGMRLIEELSRVRTALSNMATADVPPGAGAQVKQLTEQLGGRDQELTAALRKRSDAFRADGEAVTLEAVRAAIPDDAALVEVVRYVPYNPGPAEEFEGALTQAAGQPRYAAYVLSRRGPVRFVDLGLVREIDTPALALRDQLKSPDGDYKASARDLHARVMKPILPLLGDAKHLLFCGAGALVMVPFGALIGEDGAHLIERFAFTYLTSGRDLLRLATKAPSRQGPIIVANPDFDGNPGARSSTERGLSLEVKGSAAVLQFPQLPGAEAEGKAIAKHLPGARVLAGAAATEREIKSLRGPRVVHLATHGFAGDPARFRRPDAPKAELTFTKNIGTLLLNGGVALAGANRTQRAPNQEDGVLTGVEIAALDLFGTELVVMSACETGVGSIDYLGEGVFGLRRALVMTGARTQVVTSWMVDDEATRDLMTAYYTHLEAGVGRTEALRKAQRSLATGARQHPYFWAAFISNGDWTPIAGGLGFRDDARGIPGGRSDPPATAGSGAGKTVGAVLVTVGVLGVLAGGTLGVLALSNTGQLDDACPQKRCGADQESRLAETKTMAMWSTIGLGAGAGSLLVGAVILAASGGSSKPGAAVRPFVGLGSAGLQGAF